MATQGLGLGMEPGEEWEEWELWEEMRVPNEACRVGEDALAGTGPGQDASQVVEAMAEWEAEGMVVPIQMARGGVGEGGFVAPEPRPRALASVVGEGARGGWGVGQVENEEGV